MRVKPDTGYAAAAFVFVGLRFLVVDAVLAVAMAASGEFGVGEALLFWVSATLFFTLVAGPPVTLWWWLRPGRVSYVVDDGELRVIRGRKVVRRHPCADITELHLTGGLTWHELTLRNWFTASIGGWPRLSLDRRNWPRPRALVGPRRQPATLLWGEERCAHVEEELRRAVRAEAALLDEER